MRPFFRTAPFALVLFLSTLFQLHAQAPAAPKPPDDTLIFINGEQLSGALETADNDGVTFKSNMAGEIKVKWANVKELRSDKHFALLTKNEKLTRRDALGIVPEGSVKVADKNIEVTTSTGPKSVPLADANLLLDATAFDNAIHHSPTLTQGWGGAVTGGATLVRATQNSTSFNGAVSLVRATPAVAWLPPKDRTTLDYTQSYGTTTQPQTATLPFSSVVTNIFHASAERDEYFSSKLFGFGAATFDHDFSQSLALQQAYGGGIGMTVIKNAKQQLDLKGDIHYEKQQFFIPASNLNIIGSTFSDTYLRHLPKGLLLNEFASISPAWNNTQAYSAHINGSLIFPVYKGLGFNVGAVDDYLNNAPVGSKKNSTQFTTGLTYTIKPRY